MQDSEQKMSGPAAEPAAGDASTGAPEAAPTPEELLKKAELLAVKDSLEAALATNNATVENLGPR